MSKLNLFLVSLVAAIPGGVLSAIVVYNFLNITDTMSVPAASGDKRVDTSLAVMEGFVLAISAVVTVLPFGILIFGPKTEKPSAEVRPETPSSASQAEVAVVAESQSEVLIPSRDSDDFEATDSEMPNIDLGDEFQSESEMESVDFGADFNEDFNEEEEEEEEEPGGRNR